MAILFGRGSKPIWYHFGVGAAPILVYFSGDWDVHWGYDLAFDPWPFFSAAQCVASFFPFFLGRVTL